MSTIERAQVPSATAFASDIWLASSTNSTSRRAVELVAREQPLGPRDTSTVPAASAAATAPLSARPGHAARVASVLVVLPGLLDRPDRDPFLGRGDDDRLEQVADRLVRLGRDRRRAAVRDEVDDHPGRGVGLARARWALDRQDATVELEGKSASRVQDVLARLDQVAGPAPSGDAAPARRSMSRIARYGPSPSIPSAMTASATRRMRQPLRPAVDAASCGIKATGCGHSAFRLRFSSIVPPHVVDRDDRAGTLARVRGRSG